MLLSFNKYLLRHSLVKKTAASFLTTDMVVILGETTSAADEADISSISNISTPSGIYNREQYMIELNKAYINKCIFPKTNSMKGTRISLRSLF